MYNLRSLFSSQVGLFNKVGCVFPIKVASRLLHVGFGPNDHREDALNFSMDIFLIYFSIFARNVLQILACAELSFFTD